MREFDLVSSPVVGGRVPVVIRPTGPAGRMSTGTERDGTRMTFQGPPGSNSTLTLLDEGSYILVGAVGFLVLDNNKIEFYFCAMYQQRQLAPALRQAISGFPAILLTGPRQSGKTTFLRHEAGELADYSSFDDPLERDFALVDPTGFPGRFTDRPVILDEIQHVPALLSHLKMRIDREPDRCGRSLLTGSQQFGLMRDVSESLAGRVAILELPPFSHTEFARSDLEDVLWDGGYPIRAIHPDRRDLWLRSYISTYIERDVRQIRNIPDLRVFSQFLKLAAAHHSQEFHPADLSRELGITQPTVKSWGAYSKRLMLRTSCRHGFAAMANVW